MKMLAKLIVGAATLSSLTLTGCTDQETTIATGALVGAAIGGVISNNNNDRYDRGCYNCGYNGGYNRGGGYYRDYNGRPHNEYRPPVGRGRHYDIASGAAKTTTATAAALADKYQLSIAAAERIDYTVQTVAAGDTAALDQLNLASYDAQTIGQQLDVAPDAVQALITDVKAESAKQAADFNSSFWTTCRASGKWATPENSRCESASWSGCSPETGATLCYAR